MMNEEDVRCSLIGRYEIGVRPLATVLRGFDMSLAGGGLPPSLSTMVDRRRSQVELIACTFVSETRFVSLERVANEMRAYGANDGASGFDAALFCASSEIDWVVRQTLNSLSKHSGHVRVVAFGESWSEEPDMLIGDKPQKIKRWVGCVQINPPHKTYGRFYVGDDQPDHHVEIGDGQHVILAVG